MELVELNNELVFHDEFGMPNMWICTERKPGKIVLTRRKCCEMELGIETDGKGGFWEFCLKCGKDFRERLDTVGNLQKGNIK